MLGVETDIARLDRDSVLFVSIRVIRGPLSFLLEFYPSVLAASRLRAFASRLAASTLQLPRIFHRSRVAIYRRSSDAFTKLW